MLVKDPFYFSEIVRRRNQNSALAHHRLSNKCRDIAGCGKSDYILNRTRALLPAFFGIVWPLRTIDVGCGSKRNPRGGPYAAGGAFAPAPYGYRSQGPDDPAECRQQCAPATDDVIRVTTAGDA